MSREDSIAKLEVYLGEWDFVDSWEEASSMLFVYFFLLKIEMKIL